ncbi:MAG: arginine repressor [Oscillospiraceae bacterium]|nr:arginine repressor [Oscillospiraceae bacterium]
MKTKRHAKILELIGQFEIDTQEELLRRLRMEGFEVTQATVSRDIKELRLIKTQASSGRYRYTAQAPSPSNETARFYSIFTEAAVDVDFAGYTAVVKCHTGMAQAACASLDAMHMKGVVGTIAGDDTIFVLLRTEALCNEFVSDVRALLK